MKGFVAGIVLCGLCVFGFIAPAGAETIDGIAAVVNGDVVTYYELNRMLDAYVAGLPKTISDEEKSAAIRGAREGLLNKLIDESLLAQEAVRLGVVVRDEEVKANIQDLLKKNKLTLDQFKEILGREGVSYERYQKDLKDHLTKMRVASREISAKISVSDDEIGEYYAKHRDVYEGKEAVQIRQILFALPAEAKPEMRQAFQDLAESAASKLKSGASFEDVLQEAVAQGAEAPAGSDTGFIEKGTMMTEVDRGAFSLKVGEISPVIASSAGFHIIQVLDKRGAGLKPLAIVRDEIQDEIFKAKTDQKMQEWVAELRKKAYIDIKIK
jgi:parvulin-like peptidyl-prolyl isomerase